MLRNRNHPGIVLHNQSSCHVHVFLLLFYCAVTIYLFLIISYQQHICLNLLIHPAMCDIAQITGFRLEWIDSMTCLVES
ncbi:hypothetical protein VTN49DRAFT_7523 [Thermomyces lanuginosus]|uniref:uncharacterized protein n=1 Tax=Thermomyces lanuginosus TaxID=5541 RepID=UPI00374240AB